MNPVKTLKAVLCGQDGKCCIAGSEADRKVVDEALAALDAAQPAAAKELAAAATQRYIDAQKQPEPVNAMLVEALKDTAQTLAWMQHGKCRGFSDGLLTTQEALDKARAALTAAKQAQPVCGYDDTTGNCTRVNCCKQAQPERAPLICTWTQEDDFDMPGVYHTACGEMWSFTEGGIKENNAKFCPYCGGGIKQGGQHD